MDISGPHSYDGAKLPRKTHSHGIFYRVQIPWVSAQIDCRAILVLLSNWYYMIPVSYSTGFLFNLLSKLFKFDQCQELLICYGLLLCCSTLVTVELHSVLLASASNWHWPRSQRYQQGVALSDVLTLIQQSQNKCCG